MEKSPVLVRGCGRADASRAGSPDPDREQKTRSQNRAQRAAASFEGDDSRERHGSRGAKPRAHTGTPAPSRWRSPMTSRTGESLDPGEAWARKASRAGSPDPDRKKKQAHRIVSGSLEGENRRRSHGSERATRGELNRKSGPKVARLRFSTLKKHPKKSS